MRIEEDVIFVVARGDVTGAEVIALCEQLMQLQQKYGWAFEILDARAAAGMSADARRQNADWYRKHNLNAEAVAFGAGHLLATILALMINAYRLLGNRQLAMHFVDDEAAARAWIEQRRETKRAQAQSK